MGRVPDAEIERLKREVSVAKLAEARGVELSKSGENLLGLCPFHDDREPSLVITPAKNLWHCLGACKTGGSPIDWVMRAEGASFRHAVELLRGGAELSRSARDTKAAPKHSLRRKLEPLAESKSSDAELMQRVVDHYRAALQKSPDALAYLERRGLTHPELVERFQLGFCDRTLGYRLPAAQVKLGSELRRRLGELGVLRASGHEHLRGMLVIPLLNERGEVVQLYGRRLDQRGMKAGAAKHLYLAGPQRGVFNREGLDSEEVIVCESLIDALTFWSAGYRNVTSAYGIEGVTAELLDAIEASPAVRVKIAFDRDDAGERGSERLSEQLRERGLETYRVLFPRGMDANEYAQKVGPGGVSLGLALKQAEWLGKGKKERVVVATAAAVPDVEADAVADTNVGADAEPAPADAHQAAEQESARIEAEAAEAPHPAGAPEPLSSLAASPEPPSSEPPAAAPQPPSPEVRELGPGEHQWRFGRRVWRVRQVAKSQRSGELRANVMLTLEPAITTASAGSATANSASTERSPFFVDTLDLYAARQRAVFVKHASDELGLGEREIAKELGEVLLALEQERDKQTAAAAEPPPANAMTDEEREDAMKLLRDPELLDRVVEDLERAGIVGEVTNKLVGYLAATSRKLDEPLAIVIQSSSAAGKSSLMEAVLSLIPEEERVQYSAMTGQSLFYMNGQDLKHKVLAIVEEEGAERASYALKLLQSEGELTIASTGKDPATGRLVTQTYRVEGPVMIFLTTTAIEVDEELLNRCVVLTVDEGRAQTRAIHERQRRSQTLSGQMESADKKHIRRLYRNAQRLLEPVAVVNPFAEQLRFPDHTTRTRRDHMKYLTMIRAVTLLHQHQRPRKSVVHRGKVLSYIESTRQDVEMATRLAHAALGRSLDELPPQTRRLLYAMELLVRDKMAEEGTELPYVRFTRREVRERTGWGNTQLKVHMKRLEELEYILMHRTRGPLVTYELRYAGEGKNGEPFVIGLSSSTDEYDADWSGAKGDWSGSKGDWSGTGRVPVGPWSGTGRPHGTRVSAYENRANGAPSASSVKIASRERVSSQS